jgi:hypothetical protein
MPADSRCPEGERPNDSARIAKRLCLRLLLDHMTTHMTYVGDHDFFQGLFS